jgi:hypothetical protein
MNCCVRRQSYRMIIAQQDCDVLQCAVRFALRSDMPGWDGAGIVQERAE